MKYIMEVEPAEMKNIRAITNVIWESDLLMGLMIVEAESMDDLRFIKGVKRVEENSVGTFETGVKNK